MDKQKQIEEMAKALCANCRKDGYSCSLYSSDDDWVCVQERERAEALYNAGYRKIPENAVVLSKEEYEKLRCLADECIKWRWKNCNTNEICKEITEGKV